MMNQPKPRNLGDAARPVAPDNSRESRSVPYDDKHAKLEYLVQLIKELRLLSAAIEEPTLTYLLEMAVIESDEALRVHEFGAEIGSPAKEG